MPSSASYFANPFLSIFLSSMTFLLLRNFTNKYQLISLFSFCLLIFFWERVDVVNDSLDLVLR